MLLQGTTPRGLFRPPYFVKVRVFFQSFVWVILAFLLFFACLLFGRLALLYGFCFCGPLSLNMSGLEQRWCCRSAVFPSFSSCAQYLHLSLSREPLDFSLLYWLLLAEARFFSARLLDE